MRRGARPWPARQRGVALLAMLMVMISMTSYVALRALNSAAARDLDERIATRHALRQAREALLGYAVAYADQHGSTKGPGHLPCPDLEGGNDPGVAETGIGASPDCRAASARETGLLPFRTLGLAGLADGSGAPLWYAVSENHRSVAAPPLNSETPGALETEDADDIVAVVIAPGRALADQARGDDDAYAIAAWLEGENASRGDGRFSTRTDDTANDRVLVIRRAELAAAAERRVLAEAAAALADYFDDPDADDIAGQDPDCGADADCDDGLPWLAPFADPSTSTFAGAVDQTFGHLPLVVVGTAFDAAFAASWNIANAAATYTPVGSEPPSLACLRTHPCTDTFTLNYVVGTTPVSVEVPHDFPAVSGSPGGAWQQGRCTLLASRGIDCTATYTFSVSQGGFTRNLRRDYRFEFTSNVAIVASGAAERRSLQVVRTDSWNGASARLTVTDRTSVGAFVGRATLVFDALDAGDAVQLTAVPFDLEASHDDTVERESSPGELPRWFRGNNWHQLVLAAYTDADRPGDVRSDCTVDASCLGLARQRPGGATVTLGEVRGVVLAAGPGLVGQARPGATVGDYLEDANADADATAFVAAPAGTLFNDQVGVVAP